jgi:hypothetical protein
MLAIVYFSQGCKVSDGIYAVIIFPELTLFYGGAAALWYVPYFVFAAIPGYYGQKRALQIECLLTLASLATLIIDAATRHANAIECVTKTSVF